MLRAIESALHTSRQTTSSACHIAYAACSQRACAGCSMCVYADFQSALSPISPSLRSSCPRCSESMGERHWAHAWAQAVVGVLQSSRHLGRHCRVQHQQPQTAANSVHHAHPHLDSIHHPNVRGGTVMLGFNRDQGLAPGWSIHKLAPESPSPCLLQGLTPDTSTPPTYSNSQLPLSFDGQ